MSQGPKRKPRALLATLLSVAVLAAVGPAGAQAPVLRPTASAPAGPLSDSEADALKAAFAAARAGDRAGFLNAAQTLRDAEARRLATWAFVDASGEQLGFAELDAARRDLAGWPRADRRQALAEHALAGAGLSPAQVAAWFGGQEPATPEGAMALAAAWQGLGRTADAKALIRRFWRDRLFDLDAQQAMLAGFGSYLSQDDHIRRLDSLLMGPQGPAAEAMLALVPADWQALAQVRMALRADRPDALERASRLPSSVAGDPGLAYEEARWLRAKGRMAEGFPLLARFAASAVHEDGQARLYAESRQYFVEALERGEDRAAYQVMAHLDLPPGARRAEAEFFAGWVALTRLHDPALAARHFQAVREAGPSAITQSRALYWLGRATAAEGRQDAAQAYYRAGAGYIGAFYGQLCAQKAGLKTITLPAEPIITAADRAAFDARSLVRASRILGQIGETRLLQMFLRQLGATADGPKGFAVAMDVATSLDQPFEAMMIGRAAATRNILLPERMYPLLTVPPSEGLADTAFTLAIARQESSFDPHARTPANARGLMMLLPDTARIEARKLGLPYEEAMLWDPGYNLKVGSAYLGQMVSRMGGSYLLAAAAYNAGVNRPLKWVPACGDPRAGGDPVNFIECVPYGETRDYMMRVMENLQVYRARLAGGTGPLTLDADLRR